MFWFVALLLIAGAGFYFYQRMVVVEQEIRIERKIEKAVVQAAQEPEEHSQGALVDSENKFAAVIPEVSEATALKETLLAEVAKLPGMKQTELYPFFADINKKQLQKLIKEMADNGVLRREKQGSSYLLYPAE